MATQSGVIGLLAGTGFFPEVIARAIKSRGLALVCLQVAGESSALLGLADHYQRCSPGALAEVLDALRTHRVREVLVAGRFGREELLARGDAMMERVMEIASDHRDVPLFRHLAALLAGQGIVLLDQTLFVGDLLAPAGVLTARTPTPDEEEDLRFGRSVARRIADLDVGQTVVVRRGVILAVEAAEGTDLTIRRAGAIAAETVVVKVSRNYQDPRFDIPAVGPDTITTMREASARVLGIDAHRTLIIHRDRMIANADAAGITVVAADAPRLGTPVHEHS